MCEIKKMLFSVSEKQNPMVYLWVDDMDVNKMSDAIIIALKHQVAYLFNCNIGSKITLKKSKTYYNVEVPDSFTNIFEGYKTSDNNSIKIIGTQMNNAFNNYFNSISFLKNGEITSISREECNNICSEYLDGYFSLYNHVLERFNKSDNKAFKNIYKTLTSDGSKPADIKESNIIMMNYMNLLNNYLGKQHLKVE